MKYCCNFRNMNTRVDGTTLRRGGVRGSLQSSKKEDLNKDNINNRNSVMGYTIIKEFF